MHVHQVCEHYFGMTDKDKGFEAVFHIHSEDDFGFICIQSFRFSHNTKSPPLHSLCQEIRLSNPDVHVVVPLASNMTQECFICFTHFILILKTLM